MKLDKEYYNKTEFSKLLKISVRTIEKLENENIINKGERIGRQVLYSRNEILKALAYYKKIPNNENKYDLIFSNNVNTIQEILNKFKTKDPKINIDINIILNDENINRIYIDKKYERKEDYDFIKKLAKIKEIEVVEI